ncbi:hypothetical protein EB796_006603 [Bugula neritina]|uniref:Uncharacterized protein n=1 Tax=Bugula neritina TaxID=10212 RepID=A0A7J7KC13_BUGNE|nr:hypothetical protein EB796_006603 [Bugula neritina]
MPEYTTIRGHSLVKDPPFHEVLTTPSSNPAPCTSSTEPSIETLVSAGFASGVFITILPTVITCYFYWKKRRYRSLSGCTIFSPATTETQPDTVSAAASRRSSHVYDDISVVNTEKEKTKPGYVYNVECEDMGIDDDGYFESLE